MKRNVPPGRDERAPGVRSAPTGAIRPARRRPSSGTKRAGPRPSTAAPAAVRPLALRYDRPQPRAPWFAGQQRAADSLASTSFVSIPLAQAPTVTLDNLDWFEQDGIDPDAVIMNPEKARERGPTSTVTFPTGNLAPAGLVIKARPGATLS